jgi:hypothetical protein
MHFDGANGSTTFTDATGRSTFNRLNTGTTISTSSYKFGGASLYSTNGGGVFAGGTPYSGICYFPGDFTIEGWVVRSASSDVQQMYYVAKSSIYQFILYSDGHLVYTVQPGYTTTYGNSLTVTVAGSGVVPADGRPHHIAVTRQGTTVRAFVDGVLGGTGTSSALPMGSVSPTLVYLGGLITGASAYEDEVRVLNGYAAYTSNFTPPTAPFTYP